MLAWSLPSIPAMGMDIDEDWAARRLMQAYGGLLAEAWVAMEPNLAGLTDQEYFWEPTPGCWGVRRRGDVRSDGCWGRGDWVVEVGSQQPPMTTIGWRLMHAYDCVNDYGHRAFGRPRVDLDEVDVCGAAAGAVAALTQAVQRLREDLGAASDVGLAEPDVVLHVPRWRLVNRALNEGIAHVAEIGALRQIYGATSHA